MIFNIFYKQNLDTFIQDGYPDIVCEKAIRDSITGELVCLDDGKEGLVIEDRPIDYGPPRKTERRKIEEENAKRYAKELELRYWNAIRNQKIKYAKYKRYRKNLEKLINKARKYAEKNNLEVDWEKLYKTKKFVHTLKSTKTIKAIYNVRSIGLEKVLSKIAEFLLENYPTIGCRSTRGRYAASYIIYVYLRENRIPSNEEIIRLFQISKNSYRRILRQIKSYGILEDEKVLYRIKSIVYKDL